MLGVRKGGPKINPTPTRWEMKRRPYVKLGPGRAMPSVQRCASQKSTVSLPIHQLCKAALEEKPWKGDKHL
ncbi:hypothetical protein VULLAG_LOCUS3410 [Vulpes lagopus]